jgi:NAD-dependent protein deacetylase/lipoamidase
MKEGVARARDLIGRARRILVLTGAGISAESGVPTFRGVHGLWRSHRPEALATPEAFARDPRLVWEWYAWRRALLADCPPNPGHLALARLALTREGTSLVTQNVDGLHHRAARDVAGPGGDVSRAYPLELHGAIQRDRCSGCDRRSERRAEVDTSSLDALPRCEACGALLRPDVVWFGEVLDARVVAAAFEAARTADVCLVVGTSAVVYPAAAIPEVTARRGGELIEINLEPTPVTAEATVALRGAAGNLLPDVLSAS